jgi:hypothetical protein
MVALATFAAIFVWEALWFAFWWEIQPQRLLVAFWESFWPGYCAYSLAIQLARREARPFY